MNTHQERNKLAYQVKQLERAGIMTLAQVSLILCLAAGSSNGVTLIEISKWTELKVDRCSAALHKLKYYGFTENRYYDEAPKNVFWVLTAKSWALLECRKFRPTNS